MSQTLQTQNITLAYPLTANLSEILQEIKESLKQRGCVIQAPHKNMTTKEAAQYCTEAGLRVTPKTLECWRSFGRGPKYKKVGGRVLYEQPWLDEYIAGIEVKVVDPSTGEIR